MIADDIKRLIMNRHPTPEWAVFAEMRRSTGSGGDQAIDVAAFNCWPSSKLTRVAYEVKISRGDFLREIDNPTKRAWVEKYFHQTYFVCKHDICKEAEIPDGWGLFVTTKKGDKIRRVRAARHREEIEENPPYWFMVAALRRSVEEVDRLQSCTYKVNKTTYTPDEFKEFVEDQVGYLRKQFIEEQTVLHSKQREYVSLCENLSKPLRTLKNLAMSQYVPYNDKMEHTTSEMVIEWAQQARARGLQKVTKQLEDAHESLGTLLDKINREATKPPPPPNTLTWTPEFEVTIPLKRNKNEK